MLNNINKKISETFNQNISSTTTQNMRSYENSAQLVKIVNGK
jgi:hypothetical protein